MQRLCAYHVRFLLFVLIFSSRLDPSRAIATNAQSRGDDSSFLIHKGRSEAMIRRAPSLAGVTLCKGWSDEVTQVFISAVDQLGT